MGEDKYDPTIILGRPFLSTVKAIIYIGTGEVHMHFPSEKVRRYFTDLNYIVEHSKQVRTRRRRRNRNQRRQIIKDGWADYEGDRSTESGVEREDSYTQRGSAAKNTDYAIQRILGLLRKWRVAEDLKTPNALPRGKLGSYPFPFNYLK